ncbi:MAG: hypothetical protein WC303_02940, partial [Candidatus Paceibacterota bacterium]
MTLSLATITTSGIVLTTDSRQTYRNKAGMTRIGSDSAMKLFQLNDRVGVVISGRAFLSDVDGVTKNIGWFIEEFKKKELKEKLSVKEIAQKLNDYLSSILVDKEMAQLENQIKEEIKKQEGTDLKIKDRDGLLLPYSYKTKDGKTKEDTGRILDTVHLVVAGIDNDLTGRAYSVYIPKGVVLEKDTKTGGVMWIGQTDVLIRIIKGFAPEIDVLDFVKEAKTKDKTATEKQLNQLEYLINWGTMTLQDAIDFGILITRTPESIQRFSDGTFLSPGGITGVGGDIDVAVITPEKGFVWLNKK